MSKTNPIMKIRIVTPERSVFEGDVSQATLPTKDGEVTILPNHISYITSVKAGEVIIKQGSEKISIAVSGGFLEFSKNNLIVLTDTAERAEEIDLARAEEARKRAEDIKHGRIILDDTEFAQTAAMLEKEITRVKVARKHHTRKGINFGL